VEEGSDTTVERRKQICFIILLSGRESSVINQLLMIFSITGLL